MTRPKRPAETARRRWIVGGIGFLACAFVAWLAGVVVIVADWPAEPRFRELDGPNSAAASRHGVAVVTPDGSITVRIGADRIVADQPSREDTTRFAELLGQEL